jgi:hypothetical protein
LIAHLDILLALAFLLYTYRDLWPLLTYYLNPSDIDSLVTWARVGLLGVAAVVIPLIRPRTYVPVDPYNPTPKEDIHPEQTAPLISFIFFEYMTPMVLKAWKTASLPYDDFQPMADYDTAQHLYDVSCSTVMLLCLIPLATHPHTRSDQAQGCRVEVEASPLASGFDFPIRAHWHK